MWRVLLFFRELLGYHQIHTNPYKHNSFPLLHGTSIWAAAKISANGFDIDNFQTGVNMYGRALYTADTFEIAKRYMENYNYDDQVVLHLRFKAEFANDMTYVVIRNDSKWTGWKNNPGVDAAKIISSKGGIWVIQDPKKVEVVGMSFSRENQFSANARKYNTSVRKRTGVLTIHQVRHDLRSGRSNLRAHVTVLREGSDGSLRDIPTKREKRPDDQ